VAINTDKEFLVCCDCEDDCSDKSKCACWQLTVSHTVASNPEARVHPNVGYEFRRLLVPIL
jgi:histone-lysine N-methyltransferase SETDB1